MTLSSIVHRFLLSVVLAAPFYNLMKKSEHKIYIIAAVLIFLNIILTLIGERAKRSVAFKPVNIRARGDFLKKIREYKKTGQYQSPGKSAEERLRELKKMHERDLITEEEYRKKREEIINGI